MAQLAVVTSEAPEVRSHSGYRLIIEPGRRRVRAILNGETVADSARVLVMHETGYRPVTYVPREDVRMDLMRPSALRTHCPFKGDASYWTIFPYAGPGSTNTTHARDWRWRNSTTGHRLPNDGPFQCGARAASPWMAGAASA